MNKGVVEYVYDAAVDDAGAHLAVVDGRRRVLDVDADRVLFACNGSIELETRSRTQVAGQRARR